MASKDYNTNSGKVDVSDWTVNNSHNVISTKSNEKSVNGCGIVDAFFNPCNNDTVTPVEEVQQNKLVTYTNGVIEKENTEFQNKFPIDEIRPECHETVEKEPTTMNDNGHNVENMVQEAQQASKSKEVRPCQTIIYVPTVLGGPCCLNHKQTQPKDSTVYQSQENYFLQPSVPHCSPFFAYPIPFTLDSQPGCCNFRPNFVSGANLYYEHSKGENTSINTPGSTNTSIDQTLNTKVVQSNLGASSKIENISAPKLCTSATQTDIILHPLRKVSINEVNVSDSIERVKPKISAKPIENIIKNSEANKSDTKVGLKNEMKSENLVDKIINDLKLAPNFNQVSNRDSIKRQNDARNSTSIKKRTEKTEKKSISFSNIRKQNDKEEVDILSLGEFVKLNCKANLNQNSKNESKSLVKSKSSCDKQLHCNGVVSNKTFKDKRSDKNEGNISLGEFMQQNFKTDESTSESVSNKNKDKGLDKMKVGASSNQLQQSVQASSSKECDVKTTTSSNLLQHLQCHMPQSPILGHRDTNATSGGTIATSTTSNCSTSTANTSGSTLLKNTEGAKDESKLSSPMIKTPAPRSSNGENTDDGKSSLKFKPNNWENVYDSKGKSCSAFTPLNQSKPLNKETAFNTSSSSGDSITDSQVKSENDAKISSNETRDINSLSAIMNGSSEAQLFLDDGHSVSSSPTKLDDWIYLNVGGESFVTSRATLVLEEPESMLAK